MKTQLFLTIAMLVFNLNMGFADGLPVETLSAPASRATVQLAPVAPVVADFNDLAPESAPAAVSLVPVTPKEAGFDDASVVPGIDTLPIMLSPSTPNEADFEDNVTSSSTLSLNPITPSEAGFEENV